MKKEEPKRLTEEDAKRLRELAYPPSSGLDLKSLIERRRNHSTEQEHLAVGTFRTYLLLLSLDASVQVETRTEKERAKFLKGRRDQLVLIKKMIKKWPAYDDMVAYLSPKVDASALEPFRDLITSDMEALEAPIPKPPKTDALLGKIEKSQTNQKKPQPRTKK